MNYVLYHTLGCHLCEQAETVIAALEQQSQPVPYRKVDISADDALVDAFGIRIPVLCHPPSQQCLDWPFDEHALQQWLAQLPSTPDGN